MSKDIMGISRIQEEIDKAPEVQSAAGLLQEVKECSRQLAAVCNATETLCEKTDPRPFRICRKCLTASAVCLTVQSKSKAQSW